MASSTTVLRPSRSTQPYTRILDQGSSRDSPSPGEIPVAILRVQVHSCQDLKIADRNGYSDPFVIVSLSGKQFKTPVCKRNLNPVYEPQYATFDFPIYGSLVHMLGPLEFVVWDKDRIRNDYLGEYKLSVDKWVTGTAFAFNDRNNHHFSVHLVSSRPTTVRGAMRIKVGFVHAPNSTSQPDFGKVYDALLNPVLAPPCADEGGSEGHPLPAGHYGVPTPPQTTSQSMPAAHIGIVMLEICGARDLPDWPNVLHIGWDMDPFVQVSFGNQVIRTSVVRHSRNPVWNEQPLTLHVFQQNFSLPIQLAVFDRDRFSSNDYVGEAKIDIADLIAMTRRKDSNNEFHPIDFPIMHPFNLFLSKNPKREYTRTPTISFRASYRSDAALRKQAG